MKETVEISVDEYIKLRNTINTLQSENHYLKTLVESIKVVMQNSELMK